MSHQGRVLGQLAVAEHSNEIPAAPGLLAGRNPQRTVTTRDAGLTKQHLYPRSQAQGSHYLMVVKGINRRYFSGGSGCPVSGVATGETNASATGGVDGGQGARTTGDPDPGNVPHLGRGCGGPGHGRCCAGPASGSTC